MSRGAAELYRLLHTLWQWTIARQRRFRPSQEWMAQKIGRTTRTVRTYLEELQVAGLLRIVRTRSGNVYTFTAGDTAAAARGEGQEQVAGAGGQEGGDRKSFPVGTGNFFRSEPEVFSGRDRKTFPVDSSSCYRATGASSSAAPAAAADLFAPLEIQDAKNLLLALDLDEPTAERFARADDRLAVAVASFCARRFRDPSRKPVMNKRRFLIGALMYPERYGFARAAGGDGEWIPPAEQVTLERLEQRRAEQRQAALADQAAAAAADLERKRREQAEVEAQWAAADEATRAAVEAAVLAKAGPCPPPASLLRSACLGEFRRRLGDAAALAWFGRWRKAWDQTPEAERSAIAAAVRAQEEPPANHFAFFNACLRELELRHSAESGP